MNMKLFDGRSALAFALIAILVVPATAMAQRGRGAPHPTYSTPHYGGGYRGYSPAHYYGGNHYGGYRNFAWYGGVYYAYPYTYPYGVYNYPTYLYSAPSVYVVGSSAFPSGAAPTTYSSAYEPAPVLESNASIEVRVPAADAKVWFDGTLTTQSGNARSFTSPSLKPVVDYTYHVRAVWTGEGHDFDQSRAVHVRAGQPTVIDFTKPEQETLPRPGTEK